MEGGEISFNKFLMSSFEFGKRTDQKGGEICGGLSGWGGSQRSVDENMKTYENWSFISISTQVQT